MDTVSADYLYALLKPAKSKGIDPARVHELRPGTPGPGPVVYWMSRDQRVRDNWGLLHAQALALRSRAPLVAVFALAPRFLQAPASAYAFMLAGLREVEAALGRLGIGFRLLAGGDPAAEIAKFAVSVRAGAVVTDFDPLRIKKEWQVKAAALLDVPLHEVDSRNVVPCRFASGKQEWAARTLRRKLAPLLARFVVRPPRPRPHPVPWREGGAADWGGAAAGASVVPGERGSSPRAAPLRLARARALRARAQRSERRGSLRPVALPALRPAVAACASPARCWMPARRPMPSRLSWRR